jgi:multicomponent Na+:H+ antiporter subunit E
MNAILWNIVLAVAWAALTGSFAPANLLIGFVVGSLVIWFVQRPVGSPRYFRKLRQVAGLALFFLWELLLANLRVAFDVVTPRHHMRPAIIAIPLDAQTDDEITLLSNLVTLTPGTLSIDVSPDRKYLYIHSMYAQDVEAERQRIKRGFERRVLEVLR